MPYKDKDRARAAVTRRRRKVTAIVKASNGGACVRCGYSVCQAALEFHHVDPDAKEFGICDGRTRSIKRVLAEADKCVLLCANCHRELHDGLWMIEEITEA